MKTSLARRCLLASAAALALTAGGAFLAPGQAALADHHETADEVTFATAVLRPTKGNKTRGNIRFEAVDGGVRVTGRINNLGPSSTHGFHVHEYGDLTANDGTACGGHFNPGGHEHALPDESGPMHAGDMGNVTADDEGTAEVDVVVQGISLSPGPTCILGRGLIVHAEPDDGGQPSGNAGARIAMAAIGAAAEPEKKDKE